MERSSPYRPFARPRRARSAALKRSRRGIQRRSSEITLVSRAVFCALAGITESQLRLWEHEQLISPVESRRPEPLYAAATLRRARIIRTLAEELDVNLPGIDVILHLLDRMTR